MHFSFSFLFHFVLSFAGFLFLGVYLCRGTWRNRVRAPLQLGLGLILVGHIWAAPGPYSLAGRLVLAMMFAVMIIRIIWQKEFLAAEVRGGHNALSLLVGAALFGIAVQLHYVVSGVPVFELVK
jgi:hypothetical protein